MKVETGISPSWNLVYLFKRFIDDIFGLWLGSERQFNNFVKELNEACLPYGIQFGEWSIGTTVVY